MTVCVAALSDEGRYLILAADKMIGIDTVESDMDVSKILPLHKDWRVMFAGTFPPVFEIVDEASQLLPPRKSVTVGQVLNAIANSYQKVRLLHAEVGVVKDYGYDLAYLRNVGAEKMGEATFREIISDVKNFGFDLELLVAGFDSNGNGQIFKFNPGRRDPIERADVPGFDAIGSGSDAAIHMLYQRSLTYRTKLREALYYVLESKYFGERASGVGPDTDLYVLRYGQEPIQIKHEVIEDVLIKKICVQLEPRDLQDRHVKLLNGLHLFPSVDLLDLPSKKRKRETEIKKKNQKKDKS